MVLDDSLFNMNDLNSLEDIAKNYNPKITLWQIKFIEYPELFNHLGGYKFVRFENPESIYLLRGLRMSGEHAELYSLSTYYKLKKDPFFISPKPFESLEYYPPSGDNDKPCFYLNRWKIGAHNFAIDGYHSQQNGKLILKFFDRNRKEYPEELKQSLEQFGFNVISDFYYFLAVDYSKVGDTIVSFCEALEQLLQEGKINLV
jgi:hypothetical protein